MNSGKVIIQRLIFQIKYEDIITCNTITKNDFSTKTDFSNRIRRYNNTKTITKTDFSLMS